MRQRLLTIVAISVVAGTGLGESRAWSQSADVYVGEPYSGVLPAGAESAVVIGGVDEGREWALLVESPAFTPWIRLYRMSGSGEEELEGGALALSAYEPALMVFKASGESRYRIEIRSLYETWGGPFEVSIRPKESSDPGSERSLHERMKWVSELAESSGDPILQTRAEIASILPPAITEEASVADLMRQFPGNQLLGLWDPRWAKLRWQFELADRFNENKQSVDDALEVYRSVLGSDHRAIAAIKLQLSEAIWQTGAVEEAGLLVNEALAQLEGSGEKENPLLGQAFLSRGRWLRRIGALAESRPYLERARSIFEEGVGKRSLETSYALEEFGALEWDRGDFAAAAKALELALELKQRNLGPDDLRLLSNLKRLGVAQIAKMVTTPVVAEPQAPLSKKEQKNLKKQQKKEQKKNMGPRSIPALDSIQPTFVHIVKLTEDEIGTVPRLDRAWALSILASTAADPKWKKEYALAQRWMEGQLALGGTYPPVKARADHVSTWEPLLYSDAQEAYARVAEKRPAPDPFRDLAQSLLRGGELRRSRELLEQVSSIAERDLSPDHLESILARAELANQLWRSEGNLPAIADTLEGSVKSLEEKLGVDTVLVALVSSDLATVRAEMGQYREATALALRARSILDHQLVRTSPTRARYFPRVAWTLREVRELEEMEATLLAAPADSSLTICTALHLNKNLMLADLRVREGDLTTARALVKAEVDRCGSQGALGKNLKPLQDILEEDYEAREGRRKAKGLDDLHNKGKKRRKKLLLWGGIFVVAAPLAMAAAFVAAVSPVAASGSAIILFNSLALTATASPFILGKSLADPSYKLAPVLDPAREVGYYQVVGAVLQDSGYYSEAAALHRGAIKGMEKGAAKGHPRLSGLYADLAEVLWDSSGRSEGEIAIADQMRALEAAEQSAEILDIFLHEALSVLPEQQALNLISSRPQPESVLFSGLLYSPYQRDLWAQATWKWALRKRSLVLDELALRHQQALESTSPESARAWQEFVDSRRHLAALWVRGPQAGYTHWPELDEAIKAREEAEEALAASSRGFKVTREHRELGPSAVAGTLPARSALVEYVKVPVRPPGPTEYTDHYVALILDRSGTTHHADLGRADEIDELVQAWLQQLRDSYGALSSGAPSESVGEAESGRELRAKVWDPILARLPGVDLVFVVLDGSLNQVNFPALPEEPGRYVIDDPVGVHVLSSGRDLVRIRELVRTEATGMLAMGNPDFDALKSNPSEMTDEPAVYRGQQARCGVLRNHQWGSLPESEIEVEQIASLYESQDSVVVFTGAAATEGRLKREAPGKKYLHLATHGFFLEGVCPSAVGFSRGIGRVVSDSGGTSTGDEPEPAVRPAAIGENPLLLSGLVLAGANHASEAGDDAEDGILTAEEITALDLRGLEIAALSACDTGLGKVATGEGVFGLRRALEIAGARTILMSLWAVPDEAGRDWMTRFYELKLAGESVQRASQRTSLERLEQLRQEGKSTHPYMWAGFVAAGDWH